MLLSTTLFYSQKIEFLISYIGMMENRSKQKNKNQKAYPLPYDLIDDFKKFAKPSLKELIRTRIVYNKHCNEIVRLLTECHPNSCARFAKALSDNHEKLDEALASLSESYKKLFSRNPADSESSLIDNL